MVLVVVVCGDVFNLSFCSWKCLCHCWCLIGSSPNVWNTFATEALWFSWTKPSKNFNKRCTKYNWFILVILDVSFFGIFEVKWIFKMICSTLPETNIAPENAWLEDEFPFGSFWGPLPIFRCELSVFGGVMWLPTSLGFFSLVPIVWITLDGWWSWMIDVCFKKPRA